MRKYLALFKQDLYSELEYRGIFFVLILGDLVSLATAVFFWFAVFRTNTTAGGYNFETMMSYYLLVPIIGAITRSVVIVHLPKKIKDGTISTELMKPYNIAFGNLIEQTTKKISKLTMRIPIYFIAGLFFVHFLNVKLTLVSFFFAVIVSLFSYLLYFLMDLSVSYAAFWFDEVKAFGGLKSAAVLVFGGTLFPIDLVPEGLRTIFNILPFRLMLYFPIKIAQGEMTGTVLFADFGQLLLWILFFYAVSQVLWKKGIKKYGAYGN